MSTQALASNEAKRPSLWRSSALMASGTLVSRILGFIRAAMLLAAIGSAGGGVTAAFQTANTLPNTVFNILAAGVLDAVLVPQIVRALQKKNGDVFVNRLITAAGSILFLITIVAMVAAPLLILMSAASYGEDIRSLAIAFALVCLPQIFFYGVYNLLGEVLNAREVFGPYTWAPVVNNIVGIAGLAVFLGMWGTQPTILPIADFTSTQFWVLAGSATAGVIAQALVLLIPLRRSGIRISLDFRFKETSFGSVSKVAGWTFATLGVSQIGILSTSNLAAAADAWANIHQPDPSVIADASQIVVGNAAYSTAFMIFMVPQSLIGVSLATAVFTRLATAAAQNNDQEVAHQFSIGVRAISTLNLLAAAILIAGAIPMMQLVLPSPLPIVQGYAWVLMALMPGVASIGMVLMSQRVFFAYEDAKPVFLMGIVPTILQVIVGWAFYFFTGPLWWVIGAALAETVCRITQGVIGLRMVQRRNPRIEASALLRSYGRSFVAAVGATAAGFAVMYALGGHVTATSTASRLSLSLLYLMCVSVVATIAFWLVFRLVSPAESKEIGLIVTQRFPVPAPLRYLLVGAESSPQTEANKATLNSLTGDLSDHDSEAPMTDKPLDDEAPDTSAVESSIDPGDDLLAEATAAEDTSPDDPSTEDRQHWVAAKFAGLSGLSFAEVSASAKSRMAALPGQVATWSAAAHKKTQTAISQARTRFQAAQSEAADAEGLPALSVKNEAWDSGANAPTQASPQVRRRSYRELLENGTPSAAPREKRNDNHHQVVEHHTRRSLVFFSAFTGAAFLWAVVVTLIPVDWERPVIDGEFGQLPQSAQSAQSAPPATEETPAPKISSVQVISWRDDKGDNETQAINMIDGKPDTEWHSRQFDAPFGPDTGIAIVVKLEKPATISEVALTMHESTKGGEIFLQKSAENPRKGEVLATGAMTPSTVLKPAAPVELDSFVLRLGAVPQSVEGQGWAWIYDIAVK